MESRKYLLLMIHKCEQLLYKQIEHVYMAVKQELKTHSHTWITN